MIDDAILSREAFLIYNNSFGFEPVDGNLLHWRGVCRDKNGSHVVVTVTIPEGFPREAPICTVDKNIIHPNVDSGKFSTRSLSRWKPEFHVYQVIKEISQVISHSRIATTQGTAITQVQTENTIIRQRDYLISQLQSKKVELQNLQSNSTVIDTNIDQGALVQITEDTLVDIQNELYAVEDAYDDLELDGMEFAKKFLGLRKRYLMISQTKN